MVVAADRIEGDHHQRQVHAVRDLPGSFHHPLMIHGSYENRTTRPRRATVINVFRDGVRSASDIPPLEGVPSIPTGEPMRGQFFPLLFDPGEALDY